MTDEETIARAHRAYSEMTETQAIFEKLRNGMVERLINTSIEQGPLREKMYFALQTINTVERALREAVDAGEVSKFALRQAELLRP